jgi:glycosyltransferase involved in cell wall biosynthesis
MQGLSILIPCYKESERGDFYERMCKLRNYLYAQSFEHEIICILDGKDMVAENICEHLDIECIKIKHNQGKGYAIRLGLFSARYDTIMYLDADLSTDINYIAEFYETINKGYSLVIGERNCERRFLSKLGLFVTKKILKIPYNDTQCGFKMFKKSSVRDIWGYFKSTKWLLDIELILYIQALTNSVKSIPVNYDDDLESTLNNFEAFWYSCKEMLSILVRRKKVIGQIKAKNKQV